MKKLNKFIVLIILALTLPGLTAFTSKTPETLYRVYLNGKSIGLIRSKEELEKYIDKKQNQIKD